MCEITVYFVDAGMLNYCRRQACYLTVYYRREVDLYNEEDSEKIRLDSRTCLQSSVPALTRDMTPIVMH